MGNTKWLALSLASIAGVACSGGANPVDTPSGPALTAGSLPVAAGPRSAASAAAALYATAARPADEALAAVAVRVSPSSQCAIYPEGASNDPTRRANLSAADDGEVRFFLPPEAHAWGTRLTLDCRLDGSAQGSYLVDLDDSSTFVAKSSADLAPKVIGTRPALTGDLSTYGASDLISKGYYPRPDATKNPDRYAEWLKNVSSPVDIYDAMPVTMLGVKAGVGTYEGSYSSTATDPWTGFVQAAGGFQYESTGSGPYPFAFFGQAFYDEYAANMLAPPAWGCSSGSCSSSFMWAGIGGWPTNLFGIFFSPDLLQSGFMTIPYSGGPVVDLFAEWVGGTATDPPKFFPPPGNQKYSAGDRFEIIGYAGDANCNLTTSTPSKGCFYYLDVTNSWLQSTTVSPPVDSQWWPVTTEYVYERSSAGMNEDFFYNEITGEGIDTAGTTHLDPGNSSGNGDPYMVTTQHDSLGNACAIAEWNNETINSPQDPMFLIWNNCGPN
jgi:hypothetical protein